MTSATGTRKKQSGFTLPELCMVLVLLGLLTSLVWPSLHDYSRRLIAESQSSRLALRLIDARELAIASGRPQTVRFADETDNFNSAASVTFYPDGSAENVELKWTLPPAEGRTLNVEKSGLIYVRDS